MGKRAKALKKIYRRVASVAADLLFPLECLACGKEGAIVCEECGECISFSAVCRCPLCGKESREGRSCEVCARMICLNGVVGSFDYHNLLIAGLIKAWKYNGMNAAGAEIERLLAKWVACEQWVRGWASGAVLVPVPLHKRRLCERGFNQAERLACAWARLLNLPVLECLERTVYTQAQAKQASAARQKLSTHVFAVKRGIALKAPKVILVDDVYTTGTTLNLAAQKLREAGAVDVYGLVCARET